MLYVLFAFANSAGASETGPSEIDQIIQEVYKKELGRSPDPEGLIHYRQIMESEDRDPAWLTEVLANSEEGRQYRKGKRLRLMASTGVGVWLLLAVGIGFWAGGSSPPPQMLGNVKWIIYAAFVLRGISVLCLTPPLEGIDEYQHIAVIQFRLEHGRGPIYGTDRVPESLLPHLRTYPHPDYSWKQLKRHGVRRYQHYYTLDPGSESPEMPILYQAQHPPLYYVLCTPIYGALSRIGGILHATYALRILNLLFGFGGLMLLLTPMFHLWKDPRIHLLITLVAGMSPMFLPYIARVANDPLALLFCGLAVYHLFPKCDGPGRRRDALLTGIFMGLAVLSKLIGLVLLPAGLLLLAYRWLLRRTSIRETLERMGTLILGFAVVALPFVLWSLHTYEVPFPAQETINNAEAGHGFTDLLGQIHPEHLQSFLYDRMYVKNLWTSGWSFLRPNPNWTQLITTLLLIGILVGGAGWIKRFLRKRTTPTPAWVFCGLLCAGAIAAAYVHALNSLLSWGGIVTPSHYIMVALPASTILFATCTDGASRRFTLILLLALWGLSPLIELQSLLFRAIPTWTQLPAGPEAFARLSDLIPGWLPVWGFPTFYALSLFLQIGVQINMLPVGKGTFLNKS